MDGVLEHRASPPRLLALTLVAAALALPARHAAAQSEAGQSEAGQSEAGQSEAGQSEAGQSEATSGSPAETEPGQAAEEEQEQGELGIEEAQFDDERAFRIFRTARAAFDAGDFETAQARFLEAYELSGRTELLYNVASCADRLDHTEEAIDYYERFLADTPERTEHAQVEARLRVLRARLTRQQTDPGNVQDPEPAPDPAVPPEEDEGVASQWWLWTIVGVVVVGAAVGIGLGVGLSNEEDPAGSPDGLIFTLGAGR